HDTDDDGLSDGEELGICGIDLDDNGTPDVTLGTSGSPERTNPHVADSDGDGLKDGNEVAYWPNAGSAFGPYCPSPMNQDSDGDYTNDRIEVERGRNPCNFTQPLLSISDADVNEGGTATFVVTLIDAVINDVAAPSVTVDYATSAD